MCSRDGYIWKAWLGGQTHLKPPKFGENLRALSEAIGNPTLASGTPCLETLHEEKSFGNIA